MLKIIIIRSHGVYLVAIIGHVCLALSLSNYVQMVLKSNPHPIEMSFPVGGTSFFSYPLFVFSGLISLTHNGRHSNLGYVV